MHEEITEAIDFVGRLLDTRFPAASMAAFKEKLYCLLSERFVDHWDVTQPTRGNAYRALSNFNSQLDPILIQAAVSARLAPQSIMTHLPQDFIIWIDPLTVSYRIGDHSNVLNLYKNGKSLKQQRTKLQSPSSTPIRISPPPSPAKNSTKVQQNLHTKKEQVQPATTIAPPNTPPPSATTTQTEVLVH
ncbi:hypothetical protein BC940DRAFT_307376 [Gongronella butleri]|nr:hypothetical protein BC940DRAFT_307376 [Gongronella butleri]